MKVGGCERSGESWETQNRELLDAVVGEVERRQGAEPPDLRLKSCDLVVGGAAHRQHPKQMNGVGRRV